MESAQTQQETPGRILRRAREAAGLSVLDVAQRTKFSVRQVEALEADNYALLPGATIVRGFVRSYARLLRLDVASLLATLDSVVPVEPPDVREPQNMGSATPAGGLRSPSSLMAIAMVLAIVMAIIAGWHFFGERIAITNSVATAQAPASEVSPTNQAFLASSSTVQAAVPGDQKAAMQDNEAPISPGLAGATSTPSLISHPVAAPKPVPAPAVPVTESASVTTQSAAPPTAAVVAGERRLSFVLQDKSWIEVRDASQRVLLTGEYAAGDRPTVTGRPPFHLVIGNAARVELYDGEQRIDLVPHTRAEVARLRLD